MKERDILGGQNILWPSYIFSGVKTPNSQDLYVPVDVTYSDACKTVCRYGKTTTLNSRVVSLSINDVKDALLSPPVSITLQHNNPVRLAITTTIAI